MKKLLILSVLMLSACGDGQLFGSLSDDQRDTAPASAPSSSPESTPSDEAPAPEPSADNVQNCVDAGTVIINATARLYPRLNAVRGRLVNILTSECQSRIQ